MATRFTQRRVDYVNQYQKQLRAKSRDITDGFQPQEIDWERRIRCKHDLRLFCQTYLPSVFFLSWSKDQLRCLEKVQRVFIQGGKFALAMPRGSGKTAICRAALLWGTLYGHRRFAFLIGSSQPKAVQSIEALKLMLYQNDFLRQDFPEICFPLYRLENRQHLVRGQTFNSLPTHVEWGVDRIRYPSLILTREQAEPFLSHDAGSLRQISSTNWMPLAAAAIVAAVGIDGSIRGENATHPVTLEQFRPDVVLLDDVQKDQKADSPASCAKLIRLIDGAIQGLAGPGQHIAALMPCTVIREGDVADTFLDPEKRPEWQGERCPLVLQWPEGITDQAISDETEPGRLWLEYAELRRQSLMRFGDIRLATEFYRKHRRKMDRGFVVSWEDRYDRKSEVSAIQHAMNLRLQNPETFLAEYQNQGRKTHDQTVLPIRSEELAEKTLAVPRRRVPLEAQHLVAFIDVQDELLFYVVLAVAPDFSGLVTDYGTWPEVSASYFRKSQAQTWALLTRRFFQAYPDQQAHRGKAPLEAKVYFALEQLVSRLVSWQFTRADGPQTRLPIKKIGIDTRWGQASDTIKRFCRESRFRDLLVPYFGHSVSPAHKQFEEYTRTPGWLFEDQVCPEVKEVKWIYRPGADGTYYMLADVNRLKDFLFARLASPPGSPGGMALFDAPPQQHRLFADHVCESEYPEPVTARGLTKNIWKPREGRPDNDYLDCLVGCCALAGLCGAAIRTTPAGRRSAPGRTRRPITQRWKRGPK